jgi:hypothetical protein
LTKSRELGIGLEKESSIRSKILTHFIKGKISLTPMETILVIPGGIEYLEGLVKLVRRRKNVDQRITPMNMATQ